MSIVMKKKKKKLWKMLVLILSLLKKLMEVPYLWKQGDASKQTNGWHSKHSTM